MEKFNAVLIGTGNMGKTHLKSALASPYIDKLFLCDTSETTLKSRMEEFSCPGIELEAALKDPSIKMAIIATPNHLHAELALRCLEHGKAVLCEKPMGETLEEAQKLVKAAARPGAFLQIGFELHYSTMYKQVKDWIDAGLLGEITQTQCRYYCCEFHKKNTWRSNGTGSFLIGEKLSHYLDLQRWFIGENFENVYSLSAPKTVPYFNHRDNHQILTRYPGGKVGVLNFIMFIAESFNDDPLKDMLVKQSDDGHALQYHICGLKGAAEVDVFRRRVRRWEFTDGEENLQSCIVENITFTPEQDQQAFHNVFDQTQRVIELVARGKAPEVTAADAFETMKLCFAAEESENTGKIVFNQ
ncbi:MAG: Gfo/Idh/MocA family oxidoreductase [Lentisphaeria bacterium]|nr:Gfo/Idh/MocA family oxidoreductase [Lentisphaeria bacterium]